MNNVPSLCKFFQKKGHYSKKGDIIQGNTVYMNFKYTEMILKYEAFMFFFKTEMKSYFKKVLNPLWKGCLKRKGQFTIFSKICT